MNIKICFGLLSLAAMATLTGCSGANVQAASQDPAARATITITSPSTLPSGVVSTPYSTSLTATGGTTPYTWTIKGCSGSCNTGLGFSQSGVLSGTPANTGTSTFAFVVTDANGRTASSSATLTIATAATAVPL